MKLFLALVLVAGTACLVGGPSRGTAPQNKETLEAEQYDSAVEFLGAGDAKTAKHDSAAAFEDYHNAEAHAETGITKLDEHIRLGIAVREQYHSKTAGMLDAQQLRAKLVEVRDAAHKQTAQGQILRLGESITVTNYQYAKNLLAEGDGAAGTDPGKAYRAYVRAEHAASAELYRVNWSKKTGEWKPNMRYTTHSDGVISEAELLAKLGKVREDAAARGGPLEKPALAAWSKKYGKISDAQRRLLVSDGEPKSVDHAHCWVYAGDEPVCWDAKGMRKPSKKRVAKAPQRVQAGGGGEAAGEAEPACSGASLQNNTEDQINYDACGYNGIMNGNEVTDISANCPLTVNGSQVTPKPCQKCVYAGSLSCSD